MLSKISWGQFALAVVVVLLLYYLVIGISLYRDKIRELLQKRPAQPRATDRETQPKPKQAEIDIPSDLVLIERMINEVRYEILPKAGEHATKDKLLIVFKNYLSGFSGQNLPTPFKTGINQLIAKEAASQCDVFIDPAEIAELW
ncbi:hypothetical protein ACEN9X_09285 [Mucilaginibacter sp. Mucisp86]|uniref:hypothetical protein n=1 Tax=Mucilaginibacter sp. Mucisp86 TaxID=3243060 RepID=UPI0039B507DB